MDVYFVTRVFIDLIKKTRENLRNLDLSLLLVQRDRILYIDSHIGWVNHPNYENMIEKW